MVVLGRFDGTRRSTLPTPPKALEVARGATEAKPQQWERRRGSRPPHGSEGRATEVHVASSYAEAPMGPCLESAVRGRPITPFTDRDFETSLVFDAH